MFRKSNDAISAIVILVYALLFLFCTEVNEGNMAYLKWTPINFAYNTEIVLFFALIFVIRIFVKERAKVDLVFLLLMMRAGIMIIPLLYNQSSFTYNIGYYLTNIDIFLVYILYKSNRDWCKWGFRFLLFFGIGISIEIVIAWLNSDFNWLMSYYKYFLGIPLGKSNTIGCYLLPIYELLDLNIIEIKKRNRFVCMAFMIFAGVLIKSRSFFYALVSYYLIKHIISNRGGVSNKKLLLRFGVILVMLLVFVMYGDILIEYAVNLVIGNYHMLEGASFIERISSNRIQVIQKVFDDISRHLIFGNGMDYTNVGGTLAHNIFIDLLYQSGIVGTVLYIVPVGYCMMRIYKFNNGKKIILVPLTMLLQAFFEPGLLLFPVDFIFWLVLGYANQKDEQFTMKGYS